MYGVWAVAERHVEVGARDGRAVTEYGWFVIRTSAAIIGMAAFLALVFVLLGLAAGNVDQLTGDVTAPPDLP